MGLSVWGSPNWFVSGMDLMGSGCGRGHGGGDQVCTICVLVSWGRWALTQHTWGLMFTPRPTHTVTHLAHVRVHTLSHVCPISVACTLSDTAQLTRSDMLRCHPAYTLSGLTYPQTEFHSHAWTQPHTPVFSRLEHDHALKRYHTLTSLHSHASVFHTLTCGHFTHKHSIQALPLTSICTRAHRS